jgi:hypothetical protein
MKDVFIGRLLYRRLTGRRRPAAARTRMGGAAAAAVAAGGVIAKETAEIPVSSSNYCTARPFFPQKGPMFVWLYACPPALSTGRFPAATAGIAAGFTTPHRNRLS